MEPRTSIAIPWGMLSQPDKRKALSYAPDNANTLFNRGLVRWKGKTDAAGAIADWEKLLALNPNYQGKAQVQQLLADAKSHVPDAAGMKIN